MRRVLIFEDDVRFYEIPPGLMESVNRFLDRNESWDIFYLGGIPGKLWLTHDRHIARVRCAGVHSYILSERAFAKIANWDFHGDGRAVDTVYKRLLKGYCCFPMITRQEDDSKTPSNIAAQRLREGGRADSDNTRMWEETRRKQYWHAYFRYFHRWLFRLQQ